METETRRPFDSLVEIEEKTIGLFFALTFRRKARYYECE